MIPALERGINILNHLNHLNTSVNLEDLSRQTSIPKASLLRILETLEELNLVERGSDKRFSARAKIIKQNPDESEFERYINKKLIELAEESEGTAEWYIPGPAGCLLTQQYTASHSEVKLSAGPGFLRRWGGELDAVAALGYGFASSLSGTWIGELWHYNDTGSKVLLTQNDFTDYLNRVKTTRVSRDIHMNTNGVIRLATPLLNEEESLRGIISLAFTAGPRLQNQLIRGEKLLISKIHSEEKNESTLF